MKKVLSLAFLTVFALSAYAQRPRVTVDVKDVGEPLVSYGPAIGMLEKSPVRLKGEKVGDVYTFDIPHADTLYFVRLGFAYPDEYFQSVSFLLAPGETAKISGRMTDVMFDYDIEGPETFGQLVRHRRADYMEYEKQLANIGYSPQDVDMQVDEVCELLEKIKRARLDYILKNPDNDLSAIYLVMGLATVENYRLLGEKVKEGKYGPFIEYWMGLTHGIGTTR